MIPDFIFRPWKMAVGACALAFAWWKYFRKAKIEVKSYGAGGVDLPPTIYYGQLKVQNKGRELRKISAKIIFKGTKNTDKISFSPPVLLWENESAWKNKSTSLPVLYVDEQIYIYFDFRYIPPEFFYQRPRHAYLQLTSHVGILEEKIESAYKHFVSNARTRNEIKH